MGKGKGGEGRGGGDKGDKGDGKGREGREGGKGREGVDGTGRDFGPPTFENVPAPLKISLVSPARCTLKYFDALLSFNG
jgi:hypothetical protein